MIRVADGLYAANHAVLPDGSDIDGLACFLEQDDAQKYMELPNERGIVGEIAGATFDEARGIAKSKPILDGLLLFVKGKIIEYHYVR